MNRPIAAFAFLVVSASGLPAQSFEVSTIKPSSPAARGMTFRFLGPRRFAANNHTLKECIGFAYNLTPALISGGPTWISSDRYDIVAQIPGDMPPPAEQIQLMFQTLLAQRFGLTFHNELQELPVYALVVGGGGSKLKEGAAESSAPHSLLIQRASNRSAILPARNAGMAGFASLMQRVVFDRPVIDQTGLTGRYDFDLAWAIDGTQMSQTVGPMAPALGAVPAGGDVDSAPDILTAIQQLGLRLESRKAPVQVLVIDRVEKPDEN